MSIQFWLDAWMSQTGKGINIDDLERLDLEDSIRYRPIYNALATSAVITMRVEHSPDERARVIGVAGNSPKKVLATKVLVTKKENKISIIWEMWGMIKNDLAQIVIKSAKSTIEKDLQTSPSWFNFPSTIHALSRSQVDPRSARKLSAEVRKKLNHSNKSKVIVDIENLIENCEKVFKRCIVSTYGERQRLKTITDSQLSKSLTHLVEFLDKNDSDLETDSSKFHIEQLVLYISEICSNEENFTTHPGSYINEGVAERLKESFKSMEANAKSSPLLPTVLWNAWNNIPEEKIESFLIEEVIAVLACLYVKEDRSREFFSTVISKHANILDVAKKNGEEISARLELTEPYVRSFVSRICLLAVMGRVTLRDVNAMSNIGMEKGKLEKAVCNQKALFCAYLDLFVEGHVHTVSGWKKQGRNRTFRAHLEAPAHPQWNPSVVSEAGSKVIRDVVQRVYAILGKEMPNLEKINFADLPCYSEHELSTSFRRENRYPEPFRRDVLS